MNSGAINLGAGSQGMVLKNGTTIDNLGTGNILSSGAGTVGIFADNITGNINNAGAVDFSGDKSIGIYSAGSNAVTINNTGTVKVGNSSNVSDPSIGIYSNQFGNCNCR